MTCPTCNGNGYTTPGIGIEVCEDCKGTGEIKNDVPMKEIDITLAKIIFALCLLAWMFWPNQSKAQTKEAIKYADITSSPTGFWTMDADTVGNGGTKKDTILVDVLCTLVGETPIARESVVISEPWHEQKQFGFVPYVTAKQQERTLEWQTVSIPPNPVMFSPGVYGTTDTMTYEKKWVVTETRWLEPIEGCYQLTPLTNE